MPIFAFLAEKFLDYEKRYPSLPYLYGICAAIMFVTHTMFFKILLNKDIPYYMVLTYRALLMIFMGSEVTNQTGLVVYQKDKKVVNCILVWMFFMGTSVFPEFFALAFINLSDM